MKIVIEFEVGTKYVEAQKIIEDTLKDLLNITRPIADMVIHGKQMVLRDPDNPNEIAGAVYGTEDSI